MQDMDCMATPISSATVLAFADSIELEGIDALSTPRTLAGWLAGALPGSGEAAEIALRLAEFRAVRDAIRAVLDARADGQDLPRGSVDLLNGASRGVATVLALDDRSELRALPFAARRGAASVIGELARSCIVMVGGPEKRQLRRCGARGCGRFFLASRDAQRWCSAACGNRTRVARHHERVRAARGDRASDPARLDFPA